MRKPYAFVRSHSRSVPSWLPEIANRKVLLAINALVHQTVPARRAITLRDLLTFRCGYGMIPVFPDRYPIQLAIAEAGLAPGPVFPSFPPDELMRRYGSLPLIYQPGERWLYNAGTEIAGVLISRVAGMRHHGPRAGACRRASRIGCGTGSHCKQSTWLPEDLGHLQ